MTRLEVALRLEVITEARIFQCLRLTEPTGDAGGVRKQLKKNRRYANVLVSRAVKKSVSKMNT